MNFYYSDRDLLIVLPKIINTENYMAFEKNLFAIEQLNEAKEIYLDANDLTYISSLGLRVIFKLVKNFRNKRIAVFGVSEDVYNIFEFTGMINFIRVFKKMRRVDLNSLKLLGAGMYGSVYRINEELILKVFRNINSKYEVKKLLDVMRIAFKHDIPTIMPFEIVETEKGVGAVLELLTSNLISQLIQENPEKIDEYIGTMVELSKTLASTNFEEEEIRSRNRMLLSKLNSVENLLLPEEIETIKKYINAVPVRNTAVHGDFHAKNIMMAEGNPILIDMDEFSCGHPLWDIANINFIYQIMPRTDLKVADDLYDINGKMTYEEFYFKLIAFSTADADIIWNKFFNGYFADYSQEEKNSILELVEFYGTFRYIDVLIDLCNIFKGNAEKIAGKVKFIRYFLAKLKEKNLDELIKALEIWK